MPTGIDVGAATVRVATPDGITRQPNALRRVEAEESDDSEASSLRIATADGTYLVGDAATAGKESGASLDPLFSTGTDQPLARRQALVEGFLSAVVDDADTGSLRYVTRANETGPLPSVATDAGYETAPLTPGMAVCYDGFEMPANGIGIAIADGRVDTAVVAGGIPVSSVTLALGDWYDFEQREPGADSRDGLAGEWLSQQYETLFADVAAEVAGTAPGLGGPIDVVIGGTTAPATASPGITATLSTELPFEIGSVTVLEESDASLARGALVAADADDGTVTPRPTFAVDVPFVAGMADLQLATATLENGVTDTLHTTTETSDPGSAVQGTVASSRHGNADRGEATARTEANTRSELDALDRRAAMTAQALSTLITQLAEGGSETEHVESLRADLEALESRIADETAGRTDVAELQTTIETLETDLETLDNETPTTDTVAELESSLGSLREAIDELERDTETVRAAITGLDDDSETPALSAEGVGALQTDELNDTIDELEGRLGNQLDEVWDELDQLSGQLVDVTATTEDVPEIESTVESTRDQIHDLEGTVGKLRQSVEELQTNIDAVEERTPSVSDLENIEADVDQVTTDLAAVQEELATADRVDPETVDAIQTDLDGLRQTLISRAERLESVEETTANLNERIETVYQNSAKAEALASIQTEVSRIRQTAARAMERTNEMNETVSSLRDTVDEHGDELGMVSTNVDNLAGSAVTRSEMDASIDTVTQQVEDTESDLRTEIEQVRAIAEQSEQGDVEALTAESGSSNLVVTLQAGALVALGVLGAIFALQEGLVLIAGGFLVFSIMPAVLSWLVN